MKTRNFLIGLMILCVSSVFAGTEKTDTFKVAGNCGMCQSRIEKAAKSVTGVSKADWNSETKMMTVVFDETKAKLEEIEKAIAKVGYDNDGAKAEDKVYNKLPGCCQYERLK